MADTEPLEPAQLVSIMTTEHFVLQGARGAALTDMQGRAGLFLTAVSSTLVALALVGNIAKLGSAFVTFAFVLLPTLYVFGVATYFRIVQISLEDLLRARGSARIRHWYLEQAPQLVPYFLTTRYDDFPGMLTEMGVRAGPFQVLMATEAVIAFVASVVLGNAVAMFGIIRLHQSLMVGVLAGSTAAVLSMGILSAISARQWKAIDTAYPPLFPSPGSRSPGRPRRPPGTGADA